MAVAGRHVKVPPSPARLGRNRRDRGVARDGQVPGQRDPRARHRAVGRAREGPRRRRGRRRAVPFLARGRAGETHRAHAQGRAGVGIAAGVPRQEEGPHARRIVGQVLDAHS